MTSNARTRVVPVLIAAVTLAASGGPVALAQDDGVTVDPGSPTGKEYAIPFEQARRDAASGSGEAPGADAPVSSREAPLFGEGIDEDPQTAADGATSAPRAGSEPADGRRGRDRRDTAGGPGSDRAGRDAAPTTAVSAAGRPSGDAGSVAMIGIVAAAVLALGGVVGVIVRRRAD